MSTAPAPVGGDDPRASWGSALAWGLGGAVSVIALAIAIWGIGSAIADVDVVPPGHSRFLYPVGLAAAGLAVALDLGAVRRAGIRPDRAVAARQLSSAIAGAGVVWLAFGLGVAVAAALSPESLDREAPIGAAAGLGLQGFGLAVPASALPVVLAGRLLLARTGRAPRAGRWGGAPRA